MHTIETQRLYLRKIHECDRDEFVDLLSDSTVLRYCFDRPSLEEIDARFNSRLQPWDRGSKHWLCLSVFEKMSGKFIGVSGFKNATDFSEVGFLFLPIFHGLGYGTESLVAICEHATMLGIKELRARITKGNSASIGVVHKCGFSFVAEYESALCINNEMYNDLEYQKIL